MIPVCLESTTTSASLPPLLWRGILTLAVFILIFLLFHTQQKLTSGFIVPDHKRPLQNTPNFQEITLQDGQSYNHASSLVVIDSSHILVSWVGGAKELDPKVHIYLANIDLDSRNSVCLEGKFSAARGTRVSHCRQNKLSLDSFAPVLDKFQVEKDEHRYLHALGNPVLAYDGHQLTLFFVSTFGGWSTASINSMVSKDQGVTWSKAQVLKLSPFLNFSHALKGGAITFQDDTRGLPVYSELLRAQAKLLRLNSKGSVLSLQDLSSGAHQIQPIVIPMNAQHAFVWMRQKGSPIKKMFWNATEDGGAHWNHFEAFGLDNPDSALSGVKVDDDTVLLVFNNSQSDRKNLSLAFVTQLKKNTPNVCIAPFKQVTGEGEFVSYPFIIKTGDRYALSYSQSGAIVVDLFNSAWLLEKWKHCTAL